jgi:hypothetical protein
VSALRNIFDHLWLTEICDVGLPKLMDDLSQVVLVVCARDLNQGLLRLEIVIFYFWHYLEKV